MANGGLYPEDYPVKKHHAAATKEPKKVEDISTLNLRVGKAADDMVAAIYEFEHALADTQTVEEATLVASTIGRCYGAFDRVNNAAVSRKAHLEAMRMIRDDA